MIQDEKRKHIRHALSGLVAVTAEDESGGEPFDVHVFDVSAGGAGFTSDKELKLGEHVTFTFSLPGGHDKRIGLTGKIVRAEQVADSSGGVVHKYGLRINRFITGLDDDEIFNASNREITISLPEDDIKLLRAAADKKGISISEVISSLIVHL